MVLHVSLMRVKKQCQHQLALPWGTRHLISPELAGKDVLILLLEKKIFSTSMFCLVQELPTYEGHRMVMTEAII